jgi:hypothetical protein
MGDMILISLILAELVAEFGDMNGFSGIRIESFEFPRDWCGRASEIREMSIMSPIFIGIASPFFAIMNRP